MLCPLFLLVLHRLLCFGCLFVGAFCMCLISVPITLGHAQSCVRAEFAHGLWRFQPWPSIRAARISPKVAHPQKARPEHGPGSTKTGFEGETVIFRGTFQRRQAPKTSKPQSQPQIPTQAQPAQQLPMVGFMVGYAGPHTSSVPRASTDHVLPHYC